MSIYKYVTADALSFILDGSIRFTQPGGFNDPFELALEVYTPPIVEGGVKNFSFDVLSKERLIDKYLLDSNFENENCNDIFSRELISNLNNHIGILCLSKNHDSHLMWAHYADEYSGAVVEFDEEHEYFQGLTEVKYSQNRPIIHIDYFIHNEHIPVADLCIKPDVWSYEREWRLIRSLHDCKKNKAKRKQWDIFTNEIPLDAIKSVALGERCTLDNARKTYNKLKNTNIALSIAAIANWKYDFRYENIKLNKPIGNSSPIISPLTAEIFANEKGTLGEIAKWMLENHPMRHIAKWRL